jgi:hypothetical protein
MTEINKTIARQAMEALHQRDLDGVSATVAPQLRRMLASTAGRLNP